MAKPKKPKEAQEEQSARFRAEVERLVADGELNPTEAGDLMEQLMKNVSNKIIPQKET